MLDRTLWLVVLCFLLSGFAALIYQTAWTREFAFVFGASELAVATVLAAYMGGLALGSAAAARWVGRVRRPVLAYGLLEGGVAATALAVPWAIGAAQILLLRLFGGRDELSSAAGGVEVVYYLLSSFAILMVPTALMGATLPLLARHVVHSGAQIGPRIGALYAVNTVGAVAGTLVAAFWLLPALGLRGTVGVAAASNLLVLLVAVGVGRSAVPAAGPAEAGAPHGRFHWVLPAMLLSGAVSFTYEVFWFRLLAHVLGGSAHAFATMLASFLIGIALGSALAARLARDPRRATRGFAVAQLAVAVLSVLAYLLLDDVPAIASLLTRSAGRRASDVLVAIAVLLPSTLFIGATFPFAVRALARGAQDASRAAARVYAWNTVGAIVGAVGSGFWLIPALGFPGTLTATVLASAALAGGAALAATPPARLLAGAAVALAAACAFLRPQPPWALLRTGPVSQQRQGGEVVHHAVGRTATVLLLDEGNQWALRTNGLPESSIGGARARTLTSGGDRWLGLLPTLAQPETRDLLVIGLGGGVAIERIPPRIERVDVIEIEPEVIEANRRLAGRRRFDPLADPRVHLHVNDARSALLLTERRYDAITSQPSHPWTSGSSHLYTREFFELARSRLRPGGVLVQWMGTRFVDAPLLATLLATLQDTFPQVRVFLPYSAGALLLVASEELIPVEEAAAAALAADPEFFEELGIRSSADVAAALLLDEGGVRRIAAGAAVSTDDHNLLENGSPDVTMNGRGLTVEKLLSLVGADDALGRTAHRVDPIELADALLAQRAAARIPRLLAALPADSAQRSAVSGFLALGRGQSAQAMRQFEAALAEDPANPIVRAALLARRGPTSDRFPAGLEPLTPLWPQERVLVEAWGVAARDGDAALEPLDAALTAVDDGDPLAPEALRLRARWRIAAGVEPERALALLDAAMARGPRPEDFLLRARAALVAGDVGEAIDGVEHVALWTGRGPATRALAEQTLAFLDRFDADGELGARQSRLRARLERGLASSSKQRP